MLVDCCKTLIIICPKCNKLEEYRINFFKLTSDGYLELDCTCGTRIGSLVINRRETLLLNINCGFCGKIHIYSPSIEDFFGRDRSFSCTSGKRLAITQDRLVKVNKDNLTGGDRLALLLKKLYTLEGVNSLFCRCGNDNLSVRMTSSKLYLVCSKCGSKAVIDIESSEDLRLLLEKDKIVIGR